MPRQLLTNSLKMESYGVQKRSEIEEEKPDEKKCHNSVTFKEGKISKGHT